MSGSNTIARATAVIAVFTLLSKILGFVREMALACVFGASAATDAYLVAYTVPNVVFAVLGGALTVTAVPLFASYASAGKRDEAWRLFAVFSTLLSAVLLAVVLAGVPLARQIVWLVAPGLPEGTARLAAALLAVMLPGVLFLSLANLFYGLLNANGIFGPPALGPVVTNVFIIASILAGLRFGIVAVAVGALLGNIAAMVLQLPYLRRAGFPFRPALEFHHPGLKQAFGLMFPVMIGTGIGQVYLIIDRVLASGLLEGSISALNYASKLILLPQGVIVMALSTAIFPTLSSRAAAGDDGGFGRTLLRAVKTVLLVALPAGVGLAVLREPVVRLLFMRGAFDEDDLAMTVFALLCFSFGLAGQCLGPVLTRGFYALQDTACLLAIAYFSGQPFAEQDLRPEIWRHTGLVEKVRELPPVSFSYSGQLVDNRRAPADFIQFWLRKGAHVVIYGALGLSLAAALERVSKRRWFLAGMFLVLVGALDEWHQTFVPGRTGRAVDVLVDLAGYTVLAFFFSLFVRSRERPFASQEIHTVDRGSAFVSLFGERLASLRQQKGLSQAELARLLGVGQSTIAMYEKNKRLPDYQFLIRLADFFGVSTDYLLGRVDQPRFSGNEKVLDEKLQVVVIDPIFAGLLGQVSDLTEEEKQTLAEYWELALKYVRSKKKSKNLQV